MTQGGSPYDNAVAERINGILKDEFGLGGRLKNLDEVRQVLQRAVEVYNDKRPHWSCGLLTPNEMHGQQYPGKEMGEEATRMTGLFPPPQKELWRVLFCGGGITLIASI
jgi:hypothetical protein